MDSGTQSAPKVDDRHAEQIGGTAQHKDTSNSKAGSANSSSHNLFSAAVLVPAMLASSCCIPQLILNVFAFGCAGFAALTPFRPFFLALTAVAMVAVVQRHGLSTRTLVLTLAAWAVCFSDVAVSQYNEGALQKAQVFGHPLPGWLQAALEPPQWVPRSQMHIKPGAGNRLSPPAGAATAQPTEATVIMTALNIKCAACGARIKNGLKAKFGSHLKEVKIEEKSKAVVVRLADQAAVTDHALLAAMNELDSPASLVRRDVHTPPPPPP